MERMLTVGVAAGAALAVFLVLVTLQAVFRGLGWLARLGRREPLLADRLEERLAEIRPPETLAERLDRGFERVVGRGPLGLSGAQGVSALMLTAVAVAVAVYLLRPSEALAAGAGLLAAAVLMVVLWFLHRRWQAQVQDALPDVFHLLARSLRAGLTVEQSMKLLGDQGQPPLAAEFKRCGESLRLGASVPSALEMVADRVGLPDFDLLVSLVALHRDTGGNLALLVDRLANTVRSR
ncbi:MAG: type II secretion system F family protein, partial [Gemmataceae bacterium]